MATTDNSRSSEEVISKSRRSSSASTSRRASGDAGVARSSAPETRWSLYALLSLVLFSVYSANQVIGGLSYFARPMELSQSAALATHSALYDDLTETRNSTSTSNSPESSPNEQPQEIQQEEQISLVRDNHTTSAPVTTLPPASLYASTTAKSNTSAALLKQSYNALPLEMVHIPKTGGTSMEAAFSKFDRHWSLCKFMNRSVSIKASMGGVSCPSKAPFESTKAFIDAVAVSWGDYEKWAQGAAMWHLPPHRFEELPWNLNMYQNATLFAVVRNPYDRVVSEYYFEQFVYIDQRQASLANKPTASHLNAWAQGRLRERRKFLNGTTWALNQDYGGHGGHWIPQAEFCFYQGKRYVQHVLKFEDNLGESLRNLVQHYYNFSASLALPHVMTSSSPSGSKQNSSSTTKDRQHTTTLTRNDLEDATKQMIELLFAQDFEAFGYEKESTGNLSAGDLWTLIKEPPPPPPDNRQIVKDLLAKLAAREAAKAAAARAQEEKSNER